MTYTAQVVDPELRGRPECARRGNRKRGFGRDDDDNGNDGKSERRGAGRDRDDAGAAGPAVGAERRPHEPSYCGHHIMLACAARREMRGRDATPAPPGAMYSYNGGHGSPRTAVRRRDGNNRGEAAGNAS